MSVIESHLLATRWLTLKHKKVGSAERVSNNYFRGAKARLMVLVETFFPSLLNAFWTNSASLFTVALRNCGFSLMSLTAMARYT
jgi:hypothetical protein